MCDACDDVKRLREQLGERPMATELMKAGTKFVNRNLMAHSPEGCKGLEELSDDASSCFKKAREIHAHGNGSFGLVKRTGTSWAGPHLPTEILARIFCNLEGIVHFPVRKSDIAWILAQVCTRWRDVAFGEQTLWTEVYVCFSVSHQHDFAQAIMARLFKQSGERQISLSIDCEKRPWGETDLSNPFLTSIVLHATHRTTSLALLNMDDVALDELYLVVEELNFPLFPHVSELKISPIPDATILFLGDDDPRSPTVQLLHRMPNVMNLILVSDQDDSTEFPDDLDYPWDQFRQISFFNYNLTILNSLQLLSKTKDLRTVKLHLGGPRNFNETRFIAPENKIQLPHLKELEITIDEEHHWGFLDQTSLASSMAPALLMPLSAPRLTKLTISSGFDPEYGPLLSGPDAISSICTFDLLTYLELNHFVDVDIDLLLQKLPCLQVLVVHPHQQNRLDPKSIAALASNKYGLDLCDLRCYLATEDIPVFISMLAEQWSRSKSKAQANGPNVCLCHACISLLCDPQQLVESNEAVQRIKTDLGVGFRAEFTGIRSS